METEFKACCKKYKIPIDVSIPDSVRKEVAKLVIEKMILRPANVNDGDNDNGNHQSNHHKQLNHDHTGITNKENDEKVKWPEW